MKSLFALLVFAAGMLCAAQSAPAGFSASSDVLAIKGAAWGAGNLTTESYDFLDYGAAKGNRLFLQGVELNAPQAGISVYGGGLIWQPNLTSLLAKTNVQAGNVVGFLDGSAGVGLPASGASRISGTLGGGFKYILSDNLTWNTVRFEEVFFGTARYPAVSSGIAAYFGGTPASPMVSSHVRRSMVKKASNALKLTMQ